MSSFLFFVSFAGCCWNFYKAITTEPGFVPKASNDSEVKMVIRTGRRTGQVLTL